MADCEYTIAGDDRVYSESEFKKLLSEGYLDKVMIENKIKIRNIKPNEELAKIFQMPSTIQTQAPTETKDNYKIAQDVTSEVSRENPDASVLLTPKGEDLSLTAVYVGKENRGKGIGTKVLESVKKQADKLGKKIVLDATTELDEETDLGRLESFYQKNGFTKVGENKFEYNPTAEVKTEEVVTPTETVTKTEEKVTEPNAEATPETKQPTREAVAAKNMADILRKAKIKMEGGTAMASFLPGFENVWNGSIETVSKAIELGGITAGNFRQSIEAGMKALKQTDAYKAITDPKERAKISARYKKILTSAYSEGYGIDTDNLREAEFNDFNQKLEESKDKTLSNKEFNALKAEAKKFVNDNLPADSYKKSEVQSYVRNNFDKAKTVEDIQKNLDKVNSIMTTKEAKIETAEAKQAEKDRKAAVKRIKNKTNPNKKFISSKVGKTKKGKISLDAQRSLDDMREKGLFEDEFLNSLSKEDVDQFENEIDNILGIGKEERKIEAKEKRAEKKTSEAVVLESLDKPNATLNGKDAIIERFDKTRGVIVLNDRTMNKDDFEKYAKENPEDTFENVPFYEDRSVELDSMRDKYSYKPSEGIIPLLKYVKFSGLAKIRNIETYIEDLSQGSPEFRKWLNDNILDASIKATRRKITSYRNKINEYNNSISEIFGLDNKIADYLLPIGRRYLAGISGIKINEDGRNPIDLTNDEVVHLYGLIYNPDPSNKVQQEMALENREILRKENKIDPDKVLKYVESDPKLKKYYDFLSKKYNQDFRNEYQDSIEALWNKTLPSYYYWPQPKASIAADKTTLNLENVTPQNMSAIAPNMKPREAYTGPFQIIGAGEVYQNYVDSMSHAKEFIPITENARALFSNTNRPRVIEKLKDMSKYDLFKKEIESMLTDNHSSSNDIKYEPFAKTANWAAIINLIGRLKSIPAQASALGNYYVSGISEGVGPVDIFNAWIPKTNDEFRFFKEFFTDNAYLWTRLSGTNVTVDTQSIKSLLNTKKIQKKIDVIVDQYSRGKIDANDFSGKVISILSEAPTLGLKIAGNAPLAAIKFGDFFATASPIGGGGFAMAMFKKRLNKNGGDYNEAREYALDNWFKQTERTQQVSQDPTAISAAGRDPYIRVLTPYTSAQDAATRKAYIATKRLKDWKNLSKPEKKQAAADLFWYTTVGPVPFIAASGAAVAFADALIKYFGAEEDEKEMASNELEILSLQVGLDRIQSDLQSFYYLGKVGGMVLNELRGKEFFNEVPLAKELNDISTSISRFIEADDNWDDLTEEQQEDFFKRYDFSKFEERKFNKMTSDEKKEYLEANPFLKQYIRYDKLERWKEMYSELSRFERTGKEGRDAFFRAFGLNNLDKLYDGLVEVIEGNSDVKELLFNIPPPEEGQKSNPYFNNLLMDDDKLINKILGKPTSELLSPPVQVMGEKNEIPGGPIEQNVGGPIEGQQ
jgi:ribosomal protein S18 acetylase RimI-like enzyme